MTLREQFLSLAVMILMGLWVGMSYTVYSRLIRPGKKTHWVLLLLDPLFWILQALILFALLLPVNEGRLRFYMFLGMLLGFSAYKVFFERFFLYFFDKLIGWIVRLALFFAKTVYQLIIYPLFFLLMLAVRLCKMSVSVLIHIFLFFFLFPLKLIRGILRMILPERWLIGFKKQVMRMHWLILKGLSYLKRFHKKN